jgi:hypothetical protein
MVWKGEEFLTLPNLFTYAQNFCLFQMTQEPQPKVGGEGYKKRM